MARAATTQQSLEVVPGGAEMRALSETVSKMRMVVRDLNRIATRMNRTLASRLRRIEALRQ